ncbi:MAG: DNA replication/repair protein RecF [Gemmobacter sp.]
MIGTLRLAQFRSHADTRLELDGRPVVLRGPNGAGKTNVLEAVSLLSPGRGLRGAAPEDLARRGAGPDGARVGWKIAAEAAGRALETWALPGEGRQVRIDGKAAPQAALGAVLRVLWLTPAMDRIWTEAPEGRRRFLDRLTLSFVPAHAKASLVYDRAMRERNRLLRDGVQDAHWYGALEAQMAAAGAQIAAARAAALARIAAALAEEQAFPVPDLAVVLPEEARDGGDLAAALAAGRRRDLSAGRTLVGPHRADLAAVWAGKGLPAAQCSTGEQKALLISVVLANARALASGGGGPPVLLLDEVSAHLDAGRRAALYAAIGSLGMQAFLTGTEAALFDGLAALHLTVAERAGLSVVERAD